jgi:hypothetical protein
MKEFVLNHKKPTEIIDIVRSMREAGLVQGTDFDFAYNKASYDTSGWEAVSPEHTVFKFYEERWATWFALKWM